MGVSVSLSEAEIYWRAFLKSLLERLHEEINRRTRVARLFPNEASLLRLVSAVEMEISEDWIAGKHYVTMNAENENEDKNVNSNKKRIYRNNVA